MNFYSPQNHCKCSTILLSDRCVATCKPGKPGLTSFSKTLALFFIQFLSFRKMKVQDRQNVNPGLPEMPARCYSCSILSLYQNWDISLMHKNARIMHAYDFGAKDKHCKESRSDNSRTSLTELKERMRFCSS